MSTPPGLPRYRPSGRVRAGAAALALLAAAVVGVGVAWVEAALLGELPPSIWLTAPVTLGVAILLAIVAGRAARLGHVRSPAVAAVLGVVVALATDAAAFHFTHRRHPEALHAALVRKDEALRRTDKQVRGFHTVNGQTVLDDLPVRAPVPPLEAFEREFTFARFVRERLEVGWSLRNPDGTIATGPVVVGIWVAELAVLALCAAVGAVSAARAPYCERCGRYATARTTRLVNDVDFRAVRAAADGGRMGEVLALPRDPKAGRAVLVDALGCPACGEGAFVTMSILPPGARGARPSAAKELLGRLARPFARGDGERSRVDTRIFEHVVFTSAERDAVLPTARKRAADASEG